MVTAVERLLSFYQAKNLDVFKIAIYVPGLARKLLFNTAKSEGVSFALFGKEDEDLYRAVKQNLTGGPSIVFNRHRTVGKDYITDDKAFPVKTIQGFDSNALYLWCFSQEMPTGNYSRWVAAREDTPLQYQRNTLKYMNMYYWMDGVMLKKGVRISHKMNRGAEKRVGPYLVDGYDPDNNVIYEYHGCFYHGHEDALCKLKSKPTPEKWKKRQSDSRKRTSARTNYLISHGYKVVEMWECTYTKTTLRLMDIMDEVDHKYLPPFTRQRLVQTSSDNLDRDPLLKAVESGNFFGMVECDIMVSNYLNVNYVSLMYIIM